MIELKTYPSNDVLFIDFAYRGISPELNIEYITLRDQPKSLDEETYSLLCHNIHTFHKTEVGSGSLPEPVFLPFFFEKKNRFFSGKRENGEKIIPHPPLSDVKNFLFI